MDDVVVGDSIGGGLTTAGPGSYGEYFRSQGWNIPRKRVELRQRHGVAFALENQEEDVLAVVIADGMVVRKLLRSDVNHLEKPRFGGPTWSLHGRALTSSNGEVWRRQRRCVTASLSQEAFDEQGEMVEGIVEGILGRRGLLAPPDTGEVEVELQPLLVEVAREVIVRAVLGSFDGVGTFSLEFGHMWDLLRQPRTTRDPTRETQQHTTLDAGIQSLRRTVRDEVNRRLSFLVDNPDRNPKSFVDRLLGFVRRTTDPIRTEDVESPSKREEEQPGGGGGSTDDDNHPTLDVEEVVDNTFSFLIAGFETAATTLVMTMLYLASDPEVQGHIRSEVRLVTDDETAASRRPLPWLTASVKETLRMHPPVMSLARIAHDNITIDSPSGPLVLPPYLNLSCCTVNSHYSKTNYPLPWEWRPRRWVLDDRPPAAAFMPFGVGPRMCPGWPFALLEMRVALAAILRRYSVHFTPGTDVKHFRSQLHQTPTLRLAVDTPVIFRWVDDKEKCDTVES